MPPRCHSCMEFGLTSGNTRRNNRHTFAAVTNTRWTGAVCLAKDVLSKAVPMLDGSGFSKAVVRITNLEEQRTEDNAEVQFSSAYSYNILYKDQGEVPKKTKDMELDGVSEFKRGPMMTGFHTLVKLKYIFAYPPRVMVDACFPMVSVHGNDGLSQVTVPMAISFAMLNLEPDEEIAGPSKVSLPMAVLIEDPVEDIAGVVDHGRESAGADGTRNKRAWAYRDG